ncbi:Kelch repeat-containing protein [Paramyrothecium foliicola]|nr:Kelch repeat-containing protein [Paramyrothecium foliicola]
MPIGSEFWALCDHAFVGLDSCYYCNGFYSYQSTPEASNYLRGKTMMHRSRNSDDGGGEIAVLGDYLYLNGGEVAAGTGTTGTPRILGNGTYSIPLNIPWDNSSIRFNHVNEDWPLSKNHAVLWVDFVSRVIYRWGGEVGEGVATANDTALLRFTPDNRGGGAWSTTSPANPEVFDDIHQVAAPGSAVCGGFGIAAGGVGNPRADTRFTSTLPVPGMATYELETSNWSNKSITPMSPTYGNFFLGQAVCVTGFARNSLLITLGGNESPRHTIGQPGGDRIMHAFGNITIYDPAADEWYWQQTSGTGEDIPPPRDFFCAVGVQGPDSYEIFVYGGRGRQGGGDVVHDDIWVLSLPAFRWFRIEVDAPPRMTHVCAVAGQRQMIVSGGLSRPGLWRNADEWTNALAVFDLSDSRWISRYDPAAAEYQSPAIVKGWYTRNVLPIWSSDTVKQMFEWGDTSNPSPPTPSTPSTPPLPSTSSTPVGPIVGGVVGGIVALALVAVTLYLIRRRRRSRRSLQVESSMPQQAAVSPEPPKYHTPTPELPGFSRAELDSPRPPVELQS